MAGHRLDPLLRPKSIAVVGASTREHSVGERVMSQLVNGGYGGDVYLLWRALKPTFEHYEFVESWDQGGFGIGLIRRPDKSSLDALGNLRNL
mgnify:CR=1 FL=1